MWSRRRAVLYAVYIALCAELAAKALFLLPGVRARLPPELELSWRARWVGRYLFTDRTVFYGFDDYDPQLGWTLRKGLRGFRQFPGSTVSSNSRGVRGVAEHEPGPHPGRLRIVALGDSFTFGEGVGDEQTYPQRLQELLGGGAEVVNLGVHGYGHDQMLLRLREEGLRYQPDLVLLGFYVDDAARNLLAFRDYAKPRFVLRDGVLALTGSPVPPPSRALWREALRPHALELLAIPWSRYRATLVRRRDQDALMAALIDAMRDASLRAGARFAIVDLPPVHELGIIDEVSASERVVLDYARPRGVPVCRTRQALFPYRESFPSTAALRRRSASGGGGGGGPLPRRGGPAGAEDARPGREQQQQPDVLEEDAEQDRVAEVEHERRGSRTRRAVLENSTSGNASSKREPGPAPRGAGARVARQRVAPGRYGRRDERLVQHQQVAADVVRAPARPSPLANSFD